MMIKIGRKVLVNMITDAIRNEYGNSNYSSLVALNAFDSNSYWFTKEEVKIINDFVKITKLKNSSQFFKNKWTEFGRVLGVLTATKNDPSSFVSLGAAFNNFNDFFYLYLSALNYYIADYDYSLSLLNKTDFENLLFENYDKLDAVWTNNILDVLTYGINRSLDRDKGNDLRNIRSFLLDYSRKFGEKRE